MMKCPKCSGSFKTINTKQNALVEKCEECRAFWLERGEVNFFVKRSHDTYAFEKNGLDQPKETELSCPSCKDERLFTGFFPGTKISLDQCQLCRGTFFDRGELSSLVRGDVEPKKKSSSSRFDLERNEGRLISLPSLGFASMVTLGGLYAVLFAFLMFLEWKGHINFQAAVAIQCTVILVQFLIGPFILDFTLRWFGSLKWIPEDQIPDNLHKLLKAICKKHNCKMPKFGVITDSSMNAFTYGWTPSSARVVLTEGVINGLEQEETEAVLAHEMGHVVHWDFVFMTLAQMIPMIFYQIYRLLTKKGKAKKKNDKNSGQGALVGLTAYILYVISEYVVLYLSRVREYWADRFSGQFTKNPNALASALIKIGYGVMASSDEDLTKEEKSNLAKKRESIKAFGISDMSHGATYGLYAAQSRVNPTGELSPEESSIKSMQWDMWNPWAMYYELQSTHPLIAKRVNSLASLAKSMGIEPKYVFNLKKPESYWDEFLTDIFFKFLPFLSLLMAASVVIDFSVLQETKNMSLGNKDFGILMISFGTGGIISHFFRYSNSKFRKYSILSLLKKIKVSEIRGIPVKLKGKIIGRGIPGYVFSEDLVIQDDTGMVYLDYQQPLWVINLLFSLFRTKSYIGKEVIVEGWYRRAPVPYIEVLTLRTSGTSSKCYTPLVKRLLWLGFIGYGLFQFTS